MRREGDLVTFQSGDVKISNTGKWSKVNRQAVMECWYQIEWVSELARKM